MLLLLALFACRADDASDWLDYASEIDVTLSPTEGDEDRVDLTWTVEARREVLLDLNPRTLEQPEADGDGAAAYIRAADTLVPLGRGDSLDVPLRVAANPGATAQVLDLPFTVQRCAVFGDACDGRQLVGSLTVAIEVE